MAFNDEIALLKTTVENLKKDVDRLSDTIKHVRGQPVIQGYAGKRFDLNDNLNVIEMWRRITVAEEQIDTVTVVTNVVSSATAGGSNLVRYVATTPTSATATGSAGDLAQDNQFLYFCYETNRWRKISWDEWAGALLLEAGDYLLLENGSRLLLE